MTTETTSDSGNFFLNLLAKFWLPLLLVILAIVFLFQNKQRWAINFLWMDVGGPAWLMSLIIIVIGIIIGGLTVFGFNRTKKSDTTKSDTN